MPFAVFYPIPLPNFARIFMNTRTLRAAALMTAFLIAVPAMADTPESKPAPQENAVEVAKDEGETAAEEKQPAAAPVAVEEERICRRVKLDMTSRRATKVCKTADEWREFNQRR